MGDPCGWDGLFWRFYAAADADVMICRDTDSRLGLREKFAVYEWLVSSDKNFHIMRDSVSHGVPICGGMWGVRNGLLSNIKTLVEDHQRTAEGKFFFDDDQHFLAEIVYPLVVEQAMQHDHFFSVSTANRWTKLALRGSGGAFFGRTIPFPVDAGRSDDLYVGKIYGPNDDAWK